jgi:hypothetical protein
MERTRTVITLLLGAAAAVALVLGAASVAAADEPVNRGWLTPIGQELPPR